MLDIAFAKPALPKSGALVLLIGEGEMPSGVWQQADEATGGAIVRALQGSGVQRQRRARPARSWRPGAGLSRVVAVGLGKPADLTARVLNEAGGHAAAALLREPAGSRSRPAHCSPRRRRRSLSVPRCAPIALTDTAQRRRPRTSRSSRSSSLLTDDPARAKSAWEPLHGVAKGVFLTRDLVSEPPNVLNPAEMADRCKKLSELGLEVEVLGPQEMSRLGFGALLGVAQGSVE